MQFFTSGSFPPKPPGGAQARGRPAVRRRLAAAGAGTGTGRTLAIAMIVGLAFLATAVATLFAQATLARATTSHRPQDRAWTIALALFALASAALATGVSTGWDRGTFRLFYLLGAVLSVPWLALGTVHLLARPAVGRRAERVLVLLSGLAAGVLLAAPMDDVSGTAIPVGKDVFGVFPRVLAAVGSGVGATVIIVGALVSAQRYARARDVAGSGSRAVANLLIALGTIVLSSGGLIQGIAGKDEAFVLSLALGITVIYAGFQVAARSARQPDSSSARRMSLPA